MDYLVLTNSSGRVMRKGYSSTCDLQRIELLWSVYQPRNVGSDNITDITYAIACDIRAEELSDYLTIHSKIPEVMTQYELQHSCPDFILKWVVYDVLWLYGYPNPTTSGCLLISKFGSSQKSPPPYPLLNSRIFLVGD
jgi:hypothetical protein